MRRKQPTHGDNTVTHKINTPQLGPITKRSLVGVAIASALYAPISLAQEETNPSDKQVEVIEVKVLPAH